MGKKVKRRFRTVVNRISEETVLLPMSRTPDCQGRERPRSARFGGVSENVVKPLVGTLSELSLYDLVGELNFGTLRANQLKGRTILDLAALPKAGEY